MASVGARPAGDPPPLPALLDETIGRSEDLEHLDRLVAAVGTRVVTITGPGGVGKTRLAMDLAHRLARALDGNVWFAPLADAQSSDDVPQVVAECFRLTVEDHQLDQAIADIMVGRTGLLILDNFEHVMEATSFLARIASAVPSLTFVVTSRRLLGLPGERHYPLPPLRLTSEDGTADAIALFLSRASAADVNFRASAADMVDIGEICESFDGLPLAIELAAARTRILTLRELSCAAKAKVDATARSMGANDVAAFDVLDASIDASLDMLDPDGQRFLAVASLFRGGFTLHAAAAVANVSTAGAVRLVDDLLGRSLLSHLDIAAGHRRFAVLQTIAAAALDRVGPDVEGEGRRRHARYYEAMVQPNLVAEGGPNLVQPWLEQLAERPNLRSAIHWTLDNDRDSWARLIVGVASMWDRVGSHDELLAWLEALLEADLLDTELRMDALLRSAVLNSDIDPEIVPDLLDRARQLVDRTGDVTRRAILLLAEANHYFYAGDHAIVARAADEHRSLVAEAKLSTSLRCETGALQGFASLARRDLAGARASALHMLTLSREADHFYHEMVALNNLAEVALLTGRAEEALHSSSQGLELAKSLSLQFYYPMLLSQQGFAHLLLGDVSTAGSDLVDALTLFLKVAPKAPQSVECVIRLAAITACQGRLLVAARLRGVFSAASEALGVDIAYRDEPDMVRPFLDDGGTNPDVTSAKEQGQHLVQQVGVVRALHQVLEWHTAHHVAP